MKTPLTSLFQCSSRPLPSPAARPNHGANDRRIARCYGEAAESVAAVRELDPVRYATLLRHAAEAEARDGFWPPAPARLSLPLSGQYWPEGGGDALSPAEEKTLDRFEHVVDSVWRFFTRPDVWVVLAAMAALYLGMCLIDGKVLP